MKTAIVLFAALGLGQAANYRMLLGVGDQADVRWDGEVSAAGNVVQSWKASTQTARGRKGKAAGAQAATVMINTSVDARLDVKTAQGSFAFAPQEIVFGERKSFLNGRVLVDRAPETVSLTTSAEDQDFPAIA